MTWKNSSEGDLYVLSIPLGESSTSESDLIPE